MVNILLPEIRAEVGTLTQLRSVRLGQEAISLPPIHFWILALLSAYQVTLALGWCDVGFNERVKRLYIHSKSLGI